MCTARTIDPTANPPALATNHADTEGIMTTTPLVQRLHHTAYVTKDQEATRAFYEDILGFPLLATWSEADELFGAVRVYCHTFFGLADGSALAFFQFADPADQAEFDPDLTPSPFRHIALKVDSDGQAELERRLETRGHLRARARVLPLAVHRGPQRHAPRVHRGRSPCGHHRTGPIRRCARDAEAVAGR